MSANILCALCVRILNEIENDGRKGNKPNLHMSNDMQCKNKVNLYLLRVSAVLNYSLSPDRIFQANLCINRKYYKKKKIKVQM